MKKIILIEIENWPLNTPYDWCYNKIKIIEFNSSLNPTIGVEIELQLIDNVTLDLKNISPKILVDIDKKFLNRIKYELFESMIEINTDICESVEEISQDIKQTLDHLEKLLKVFVN